MLPKMAARLFALCAMGLMMMAAMPAEAAPGVGVGKHAFKFNIIGRSNDWNGSDTGSSGKVLWIGLNTNAASVQCESSSGVIDDTAGGTALTAVPAGRQTLYFQTGSFDIIDRDATDGSARIQIPANTAGYDIYIRTLGKPGGCLDVDGYAQVDSDTYYWSGHLDANRRTGTPEKVRINDLFDVFVDTDGDGFTDTEVSVFDAMFIDYFWQFENKGLRNMQVIFVEL